MQNKRFLITSFVALVVIAGVVYLYQTAEGPAQQPGQAAPGFSQDQSNGFQAPQGQPQQPQQSQAPAPQGNATPSTF